MVATLPPTLAQPEAKLYSQSYTRVGVLFATISNFADFYSEEVQEGLECLRLLNEIICDFDSIIENAPFNAVEKIKTIGATYMAAIGLSPDSEMPSEQLLAPELSPRHRQRQQTERNNRIDDSETPTTTTAATTEVHEQGQLSAELDERDLVRSKIAKCLQVLVGFVFEMKLRLMEINEHSFNNFKLRAGINLGPVTAGVIGASKPQYDIWGNTVNVASRMESTAEADRIQITQEVFEILREFNLETISASAKFKFTCRGEIDVKGKGVMTTYYLDRLMMNPTQGCRPAGEK